MVDIAINWINLFAVNNNIWFSWHLSTRECKTFEQLDPREFSLLQVSLDKYIKSARTTVSNSDENVTCTRAGHVQVISVQLSGLFNPLYFCFSVSASICRLGDVCLMCFSGTFRHLSEQFSLHCIEKCKVKKGYHPESYLIGISHPVVD